MSFSKKSIAILPFVNMTADMDNEYLSDGITEEIISALTRIAGLKVIARASSFAFKNQNIDVRHIGQKLGVASLLEGSIRRSSNRVRVTAQLINASDGAHLWAKNYDRELTDIFSLQDEISHLIANQISENFGPLDIPDLVAAPAPTNNLEAYDLLLKGNFHLKRKDFSDIKLAIKCYSDAIQIDPEFTEPYSALGEAYIHAAGFGMLSTKQAHDQARELAEKAIFLNARNARGHKVLAYVRLFYDWDWEAALESYEAAVRCGQPDQSEFITYYCIFIKEDFQRAEEVAKKGIETDPVHAISHWQLGLVYYFARQFENAISAFSAALEIDPEFGEALRYRGLVWGYLGKFKNSLTDVNKALMLSGGQGLAKLDLWVVMILMGKKAEVERSSPRYGFCGFIRPCFFICLIEQHR